MTKELSDLFDKLEVNDSVRGIILTGEGKAFMAGADITEMKEWGAFEGREFARLSNRAFSKIAEIGKPTVGAVNGFALGGGLEIALCCDWSCLLYTSQSQTVRQERLRITLFLTAQESKCLTATL